MKITQIPSLFILISLSYIIQQIKGQEEEGLVSHYPLNGTLSDISGNGHADIVKHQASIVLGEDRHGRPDSSYKFTSYLNIMQVPCSAITGLLDFTISIWVQGNAGNDRNAGLISISNSIAGYGNHFTLLNSQFWIAFGESAGTFFDYQFASNVFNGNWQWILITRNSTGGQVQIYINGRFFDNVRGFQENGNLLNCEGFVLGNDQDSNLAGYVSNQQFYGSITDLRIYSRAFSAEDVARQYERDTRCLINYCKECSSYDSCDLCYGGTFSEYVGNICRCQRGYYMNEDTMNCDPCPERCSSCNSLTDCTGCRLNYFDPASICQNCNTGYLKEDSDTCTKCEMRFGNQCNFCTETDCMNCSHPQFLLPYCNSNKCPSGHFKSSGFCHTCPSGCKACKNQDTCTECEEGKIFYDYKCIDCEGLQYMEQDPNQPKGICREICGNGILFSDSPYGCDDANTDNYDGCNSECQVEDGWECYYDVNQKKSICIDKRPIGYEVNFLQLQEQYLNIHKMSPIELEITFNKTFTLPQGTELAQYFDISLEGKNYTKIDKITLTPRESGDNRILQQVEKSNTYYANQIYDLKIILQQTVKNRNLYIGFTQKSAFQDSNGNTLSEQETEYVQLKEYYYYTEEEREQTELFYTSVRITSILCMFLVPFYGFYYNRKTHNNRFYALFLLINNAHTMYYYRYINVRWPINGIFFFRKIQEWIRFYLPNVFEIKVEGEEDIEKYKTNVEKFDIEGVSCLLLNNVGYLLILICAYIVINAIFNILWYIRHQKFHTLVYEFKNIYLIYGIFIDLCLVCQGPFILYTYLAFKNDNFLNLIQALFTFIMMIIIFSIYAYYIVKNKQCIDEYSKQDSKKLENIDNMTLQQKIKLKSNKAFHFRNLWHFIQNDQNKKSRNFFYYMFIFKNLFLTVIIVELQSAPLSQVIIGGTVHLITAIILIKVKFFKDNIRNGQAIIGEILSMTGLITMFDLVQDESEDEQLRQKFCWAILSQFCFLILIHLFYFIYSEIILPIKQYFENKNKQSNKVEDLKKACEKENSNKGLIVKSNYKQVYQTQNTLQTEENMLSSIGNDLRTEQSLSESKQQQQQIFTMQSSSNNLNSNQQQQQQRKSFIVPTLTNISNIDDIQTEDRKIPKSQIDNTLDNIENNNNKNYDIESHQVNITQDTSPQKSQNINNNGKGKTGKRNTRTFNFDNDTTTTTTNTINHGKLQQQNKRNSQQPQQSTSNLIVLDTQQDNQNQQLQQQDLEYEELSIQDIQSEQTENTDNIKIQDQKGQKIVEEEEDFDPTVNKINLVNDGHLKLKKTKPIKKDFNAKRRSTKNQTYALTKQQTMKKQQRLSQIANVYK